VDNGINLSFLNAFIRDIIFSVGILDKEQFMLNLVDSLTITVSGHLNFISIKT
jgi:hypothetical protein